MGRNGDPLGIVQEITISLSYYQIIYAHIRIGSIKTDKDSQRLWDTNESLILARWRDLILINRKIDKYLDLARELKKLWNMKVTIMVRLEWTSRAWKRDHPDLSTFKTSWNTEKSHEETSGQTPVKKPPVSAGKKNFV